MSGFTGFPSFSDDDMVVENISDCLSLFNKAELNSTQEVPEKQEVSEVQEVSTKKRWFEFWK